jgi:hypothetical protein
VAISNEDHVRKDEIPARDNLSRFNVERSREHRSRSDAAVKLAALAAGVDALG